jgi:cyclic dehypoxanthinyl futalosine synthase
LTISLAAIGYLNARPIVDPLAHPPYSQRFALKIVVPSQAARMVAEREADLGLVSIAVAAALGDVRFVPGVAIGSRGQIRSLLLVSRHPLDQIETILLDPSSRTTSVLARLVVGRMRKREPRYFYRPPDANLESLLDARTAAVVIGDPALALRGRFDHEIDLGAAWHEWTGQPMVYAAWGGRGCDLANADEQALRDALRDGLAQRPQIAKSHGLAGAIDEAAALDYLTHAVRFDLGDEERRGIDTFFAKASDAGLLPKARVRFTSDRAGASVSVDTLIARAAEGERLSAADALILADRASLFDLGAAADAIRNTKNPGRVVTYIVDCNVNYTNVCTAGCRFCAFHRPAGHAQAYVIERDALAEKLARVTRAGGVQILLQGGLNPDLGLGWYEDLFRWIKQSFKLGLHALSPPEIWHLSQIEGLPVKSVIARLTDAGLDSIPGGGAEILVDRVRREVSRAKCSSSEWIEVMRLAHMAGLRSTATMMYGTRDTMDDRILHLLKLRDLQDESGGFTAFFCWDFQRGPAMSLPAGDTGPILYLRMQAIARIVLDNFAHVGASWVTQGPDVGQLALSFGADDVGAVLFEENVVASAGTSNRIDTARLERMVHDAGFRSARRNARYEWLTEPS